MIGTRYSPAGRGPILLEIWRFREMLRSLVVRNLKVKYQRSALGFVWTLLNPLLTVGILIAVFSFIVRIQIPNYWAFLVSGYFVWNFIQQMLAAGTHVISEHAPLRRSAAFPSEVLILGATASRLAEFAVELSLALLLLVIFHHGGVPFSFVLLPLLVVLQLLMAMGFVMPLAALAVFYYDIQHALPAALLTLFYVSPVFYPANMVPEAMQSLYFLNPIAGLLTLYHSVLYEGVFPAPGQLAAVTVVSCLVFLGGYVVFNRYKTVFAEVV
ncbi:MAG: ABC transporter permease [Gemmatimonadetes bacterium]|nr:ABC transporter permease [Gemmatimonadota bacterium]